MVLCVADKEVNPLNDKHLTNGSLALNNKKVITIDAVKILEEAKLRVAAYAARRKILCKRYSTKVKNGAGKQGGFWPEFLDHRKPWRSERYARRNGMNAGLAAMAY